MTYGSTLPCFCDLSTSLGMCVALECLGWDVTWSALGGWGSLGHVS